MKSWPWRRRVGYLRVVEIALLHSRRWAGTLVVTAMAQAPDGAAVRLGAEYGRAGGSAPVRRIQRMLRGRLSATGVADADRLRILRFRDGLAAGADRRAAARSSVMASPAAWPRGDASPTHDAERHNGTGVVKWVFALVLPLALAGLALVPTSGDSQRIPRQAGRTDRGPTAPQAPVGLIGRTR
jgi:hypothetical protein